MQLPDQEFDYEGNEYEDSGADNHAMDNSGQHFGTTLFASKFAANTRRGAAQKVAVVDPDASLPMPKLFKPDEPDFSVD